jgi:hypothetical protein
MNFSRIPPFGSHRYDFWYEQRYGQRPVYLAPTGTSESRYVTAPFASPIRFAPGGYESEEEVDDVDPFG